MRLSAVDETAAKLGLRPGMALADARARIPALSVHDADFSGDAAHLGCLADWCERYSPLVALDGNDGLLLDATGVTHLFADKAGNCGEAALLAHVCRAFAALGFTAQAAMAGTASAASALARHAPGRIVASNEDARAVSLLPVAALAAAPEILHGLRRAGLKTIGAVAARGRGELAGRFGRGFVALLDRTLGHAENPISPRTPLPDLMAERRFAEPVVADDILAETLHALAQALGEILEKRGSGARALAASFFRADGKMRRIAVETAEPTRNAARIARLFHERLASLADPLDAGFGFDLVRLSAVRTQPITARIASFDENENEKRDVAFLADRLAARFGSLRVLRFHPQDTHIPEASAVALPAQHFLATKTSWQRVRGEGEAPRRPLRLFAKPEPVSVMADVPDGPPVHFRWRRVLYRVVRTEGPERIAMEWWKHAAAQATRDYFRVEDEKGRRFWLYRDGLYEREAVLPAWYVHGLFA